ncbi:MAG TPA: heparin lyase I family protein [Jatrophihabitans sp.]|uniref:heparin lyase I family protein n=1 Tax=Jatrophihabitans sp. TaxID=1932789 RepID=UPI002DFB8470|nr:heparin lyase I family protein [Jatrophihabitans sp.]
MPSTSSTTTSPSPAPSSSSSTPAPAPLWTGNYDNGTLSQFDSTSWNDLPMAPAVVSSVAYNGNYAGKYVIPAGGARCENVPSMREMTEGDDMWFSWSTMLGSDFPVNISNWQVIDQWKNDGTGSPPLELTVENGQFRVDGGYGWPGNTSSGTPKMSYQWVGAATTNVWNHWTFHVKFSSNPTVGYVDVWRDGKQVISGWHMPGGTLYPSLNSYLKVGYYRDTAISTQGTVYQDAWKAGTTAASVS